MTPGGPLDLSRVLFRNRIVFVGQPVNLPVAQRVISQLITLATIDEDADILVTFFAFTFVFSKFLPIEPLILIDHIFSLQQMYINCPGGNTYAILAIYDCMSWVNIKFNSSSLHASDFERFNSIVKKVHILFRIKILAYNLLILFLLSTTVTFR